MIPMYHWGGPLPCFKPALYYIKRDASTDRMAYDNVILLNGRKPKYKENALCGSCGGPIVAAWLFESPERHLIINA